MGDWLWRGKLRNLLLAGFLVFVLAPAMVAISVDYYYTTRSVTELALENLKVVADAHVGLIENWFYERSKFIRHMADMDELSTMEPSEIMPILANALESNRDYMRILVTDSRGVTIADTFVSPGIDLSGRSYMKPALSGYDYISEVLISLVDQKPSVVIACPIKKDGRVLRVILGIIDIDKINKVMTRGYNGRTGEVFLVNRDGVMVTESRFTADLVARGIVKNKTSMELEINTRDVEEALRGRSGFGRFKDYRGVEVVSLYRWLPNIGMVIVAKKDLSEITDEAKAATRSGSAAAALVAMVFLPVVVVAARKLSRPLEVLAEGADKIADGNYGVTLNLNSNREVDALAESFNRMSLKLKEQHEAKFKYITLLEEQKQEIAKQNEELAEANSRLGLIAVTDQLTGAYNRRYIMRELEQELAIAIRHNLHLSIIMIDIDHFKNVNDTHGHIAGDEVLKEMVKALSGTIRTSDVLGRYGGEEFIVIAPHTGLEEALVLAERLRETVSKWSFKTAYGLLTLTISLGVTTFDGKTEPYQSSLIDRLLAEADAEMYKAKAQGRNRVSPSLLALDIPAADAEPAEE